MSDAARVLLPRVHPILWAGLFMLLMFLFAVDMTVGSADIPLKSIGAILFGSANEPERWRQVVLLFRLPRALTAMLTGAALGIAGLKMQTLFRNPLADPFILGVSSGASLGVAVVILTASSLGGILPAIAGIFGNYSVIIVAAICGSSLVMIIVLSVARKVESAVTLMIVGLMFGYIASSLVSVMMQFAMETQTQNYITWTFGSFGGVTWTQMKIFAPAISAGILTAWALTKPLNAVTALIGAPVVMGIILRRRNI